MGFIPLGALMVALAMLWGWLYSIYPFKPKTPSSFHLGRDWQHPTLLARHLQQVSAEYRGLTERRRRKLTKEQAEAVAQAIAKGLPMPKFEVNVAAPVVHNHVPTPSVSVASPNLQLAVGPIQLQGQGGSGRSTPPPVPPPAKGEDHVAVFEPGDPDSFDTYDAQHGIVRTLRDAILVAVRHGLPALKHHHMFCGPGGLGKTLLAKVLWRELNFQRMLKGLPPIAFFEIVGTAVKGKADLDRIMRDVNANPGCILFVDEFHGLPLECREALKPTLVPARRYMFEGGYLETIAPFTMIGATTDIGLVDEPLQRRFVMHDLSWMTAEQLMEVIRRRGQSPEAFPIEEDAVRLLIDRTRWSGAPWEALRYYELAGQSAQAQGEDRIRFEHVKDIFDGTASTSTGSARSTDALSSSCSRRPSRARWERTTRPRRKPS